MEEKNRLDASENGKPADKLEAIDQRNTGETRAGFAALFDGLQNDDAPLPDHRNDPAAAFRFVYDGWIKLGGFEKGKPRHSVRQIKAWLGTENQVRSLETKLAGKTWLQNQEAFTLLRLMLTHWTYDEVERRHTPYTESGLDTLTKDLLDDLFPKDVTALLLPERSRKGKASNRAQKVAERQPAEDLTMPSGEIIRKTFEVSDVLVTVSRVRTIIGTNPTAAMVGFHRLMESLNSIDERDQRQRSLIWINDLGVRDDQPAARGAIYNLFFLMAQFRSIALIERQGRDDLYRWLQANCCIIIGSLRPNEIDKIYAKIGLESLAEPNHPHLFQADRLFLESVPGRWLDAPGSDAFGRSQKELWQTPTITVHLCKDNWEDLDHSPDVDAQKNLRYYYHGEISRSNDGATEPESRCIALEEPGARWSDAYRLAIHAAHGCLGRLQDAEGIGPDTPQEALTQLRDAGFAVLTLDGLLYLPEVLITERLDQNRKKNTITLGN